MHYEPFSYKEVLTSFRQLEQTGMLEGRESVGLRIGGQSGHDNHSLEPPPLGIHKQVIWLEVSRSLQRHFGNPETEVLLTIGWLDSDFETYSHYHEARVLIQKVVEVFEPNYGWVVWQDYLSDIAERSRAEDDKSERSSPNGGDPAAVA